MKFIEEILEKLMFASRLLIAPSLTVFLQKRELNQFNFKHKFFIIILLLVSSKLFANEELYKCIDYDIGGFHYMGDDYKLIHFNQGSFEIKIDIDNNEIRSEDLGMPNSFDTENLAPTVCHDNVNNLAYLTCSNRYGQIFMFNTLNNEFTWASIFGHVADHAGDSLVLRYGICEKL